MFEKVSPLFQLFEKQYREARSLTDALGKSFRSKKALELEEKLIFVDVYLHILNKIHFKEERLKFESFSEFRILLKALKRVHHYKLVSRTFDEEKGKVAYSLYEAFLIAEKRDLYKDVFELIISRSPDIWESLYATAYGYSRGIKPLTVETATRKLIDEEVEYMHIGEKGTLESQNMRDIKEGLQVITLVENIKIAVGLSPVFTTDVHENMSQLLKVLGKWNQTSLFAQHLNYFLSENEEVSNKYLELAKRMKAKKKRLALEVTSLWNKLFPKM